MTKKWTVPEHLIKYKNLLFKKQGTGSIGQVVEHLNKVMQLKNGTKQGSIWSWSPIYDIESAVTVGGWLLSRLSSLSLSFFT